MLSLRKPTIISPKLSQYIKETTNKSLEKYKHNNIHTLFAHNTNNDINNNVKNIFLIISFVSVITFLSRFNTCTCNNQIKQ
jgi:predicted transcriptional regulator